MTPLPPETRRQPTPQEAELARILTRMKGLHAEVKDLDMQIGGTGAAPKKYRLFRLKDLLDKRDAKAFEFKKLNRQYEYESAGTWRKLYLAIKYRLFPLNP